MKTAAEVMNRNFFYASPADRIGLLVHAMGERGLGSVIVLDLEGRPLGMATAGEVETSHSIETLIQDLRRPAVCTDEHTPIEIAARTLALHPSCCLVLVNGAGVAVGALSPLELLSAVLGLNGVGELVQADVRELDWNETDLLELSAAHRAPEAPGIILLSPSVDPSANPVVWAEAAENMRERLDQMLRNPQEDPRLERLLEAYPRTVRFRCITMHDAGQREQLASALCHVPGCTTPQPSQPAEPEPSPRISGVMSRIDPSIAIGS
jgi:CBS domain-containing protein